MKIRTYMLILFLCFLPMGCAKPESKNIEEQKKVSVPVRVMKIELKSIQNYLDYVGDVKAEDEALVYPKVNGKIIEKLKSEGDLVNKGDVIAFIDRDEVGFKFEKAPVESPITGVVGRVNVDIGTSVTPSTAIALLVNMKNMKIDLDVPEKYLSAISIGQSAEVMVQAYAHEIFAGKVSRISPVLDIDTRTAPIEIVIANPDFRLKSGMFAEVKLVINEHKNVPVIRKEAILGRSPSESVYVIKNNIAHLQHIKVGMRQGAYCEVVEGLKDGDLVVVMGQQILSEGDSVVTENEYEHDLDTAN